MKLLLFGGTFDPPHLGHMGLLKNAIEAVQPGRVVVVPAAAPPHKRASRTPAKLRMEMCACFAPLFPGLIVSDIEARREGPSYTVDTVYELERLYPGDDIYLTIGGDMLLGFTAWHRWRELLSLVTLVAQGRGEADEHLPAGAARLEREGGRVVMAQGAVLPLSSSELRAGLAAGKDLLCMIPPPADEVVRREKLYTSKGQ